MKVAAAAAVAAILQCAAFLTLTTTCSASPFSYWEAILEEEMKENVAPGEEFEMALFRKLL